MNEPHLSFFGLLLFFIILFVVSPIIPDEYTDLFVNINFSLFIFVTLFALKVRHSLLILAVTCAMAAITLNSMSIVRHSFYIELFGVLSALFFLSVITVYLFNYVFNVDKVEKDLIFGSVCVYLLLGVCWALLYSLVDLVWPGSFTGILQNELAQGEKFQFFLYYSFVTQTTLGYGDIAPLHPMAANLAAIQSIMGVFYLATLVSGLIANLLRQK